MATPTAASTAAVPRGRRGPGNAPQRTECANAVWAETTRLASRVGGSGGDGRIDSLDAFFDFHFVCGASPVPGVATRSRGVRFGVPAWPCGRESVLFFSDGSERDISARTLRSEASPNGGAGEDTAHAHALSASAMAQ
jgi:hypothetical protein